LSLNDKTLMKANNEKNRQRPTKHKQSIRDIK
jgi:hypothetical protein